MNMNEDEINELLNSHGFFKREDESETESDELKEEL